MSLLELVLPDATSGQVALVENRGFLGEWRRPTKTALRKTIGQTACQLSKSWRGRVTVILV